jgi:hypothetical protein
MMTKYTWQENSEVQDRWQDRILEDTESIYGQRSGKRRHMAMYVGALCNSSTWEAKQ